MKEIILLVLFVMITTACSNNYKKENTLQSVDNKISKKTNGSSSFSCFVVDKEKKYPLIDYEAENDSAEIILDFNYKSSLNTKLSVSLINNFMPHDYIYDGEIVEEIEFGNIEANSSFNKRIQIKVTNLEQGLNELFFVFSLRSDEGELTNSLYLKRIQVINGEVKTDYNLQLLDCEETNINHNHPFLVFTEQKEVDFTNLEHTKYLLQNSDTDEIKLNLLIDYDSYFNGSSFKQDFNNDSTIIPAGIMVISGGKPIEILTSKTYVNMYDLSKNGSASMLIKINKKALHNNEFHIVCIAYPYQEWKEIVRTYKLVMWDTELISRKISIVN